MKTFSILKYSAAIVILGILSQGCIKDLDTVPTDPEIVTASAVFDDPNSYLAVLAKLYAGLAISGQEGPAGQPDIRGIDEGFGQYLRGYFYLQEFPTDEAIIGWNDQTIQNFHNQNWSSSDGFIFALYSRLFYQIVICNEYLRETTSDKLDERGVDAALAGQISGYRSEARFLRALSYWHALDFFRNVPFVTENNPVGFFFPDQIQAADLFNYIESELLAIENVIAPVRTNQYGRADQGAVWTLLAKLYLNAELYLGTPRYNDCFVFCKKVIDAGYTLEPVYEHLFMADNHRSNEIIFPVTFDGVRTRTYGGTTFLVFGAIGGSMNPSDFGVATGWGGMRTTRQFVEKFPVNIGGIVVVPNEGSTARRTKLYVPGAYQGWNGTNTMTSLAADTFPGNRNFEGHIYFPEDNSPFFFLPNPSSTFAQRLGDNGADGTLEVNGDTIRAGAAGLYLIKVNRTANTYTMESRSWGIIGDATGGEWREMAWNPQFNAMEITTDLAAGQFRFIANNDPAINLGDNKGDAILSLDGLNINIDNGSFTIRLYLDKPDYTYEIVLPSFDTRGRFHTAGQNIDITDVSLFTEGYAIRKFSNVRSDGTNGSDTNFPDTDFPMFRLADVLLMASESLLRTNGDRNLALNYFNQVRNRGYGGTGGGITDGQLTLQMLLDERARELYWECHRRTDLVRFGQFSQTDYRWAWKGGVPEGRSVDAYRDVYPIPAADLGANPKLEQNTGY